MNFTIYNEKVFKIQLCNLDYSHIFRMTVTRGCIDAICLS